jgi:hypothetical protein
MQARTKPRQPKRRSRTDWKRVDALQDSDIDYSDIPKLGPDFFANAILWRPSEERNKREGEAHIPPPLREVIADVLKAKPPEKRVPKLRKKEKSDS